MLCEEKRVELHHVECCDSPVCSSMFQYVPVSSSMFQYVPAVPARLNWDVHVELTVRCPGQ